MRTHLRRLTAVALRVLILSILSGCSRSSPEAAPPKPAVPASVKLVQVKRGDATRSITLPAEVHAYQQATLYAKVAGYVKSVTVDKGDSVNVGELLADLEVPELIADQTRYRAESEIAALDYKRVLDAQKKAPDLVVAQILDTAKSKSDIAKANLERTETLLGFARITAPFSGVITKRLVDPGAFVPAATSGSTAQTAALFTLMDFSKVRVQVAVPEMEVAFIKAGLQVKITAESLPGRAFDVTITRFAQALDEATRTMLTEIELPNPTGELRPGLYVSARIIVERKTDALVLPVEALHIEKTRSSIYTVADGKAKRVTVKTGFNDGGVVELLDGVKLDGMVVLLGKQTLMDGQAVNVTEGK